MDGMNGSEAASGEASANGPARQRGDFILDCSGWRERYYYGGESIYSCCLCGTGLGPDPDDTPHAEGADRRLCGNCYRSREWDAIEQFEQSGHDR
jgi:hypothetical protein